MPEVFGSARPVGGKPSTGTKDDSGSAGSFETKTDDRAHLSMIETDLRRGAWVGLQAGRISFKKYADQWLDHRLDLAIRTRELYGYLLNIHIYRAIGNSSLLSPMPSKVRGRHAELARRHASTAAKSDRLLQVTVS